MAGATLTAEQREAKNQRDRDRRAQRKAEKEQAAAAAEAREQTVTRFRAGGVPAEIVAVLEEAGGPLHVKEITERILGRGRTGLKGKTPQATVAAKLSILSRREDGPFVKVDRGTFGLRQ